MSEPQQASQQTSPRVVIVTGMSGAGRRTAAHAMEDLGWFVVDNLPPSMVSQLVETARRGGQDRVAVGLDVRSREMFDQLPRSLAQLEVQGVRREICYLEANDDAIVRRQESARRPLPLQDGGSLIQAIAQERRMLGNLRADADVVIDTSNLNVHQLVHRVGHIYGSGDDQATRFQIMSFGFKNGVPVDADMVFDVRFLPNPHWVPHLRPQTGLSREVSDYVLAQPGAQEFLDQLVGLVNTVGPGYFREGKRQATIAIGCTGGKHRSTSMTEAFAARLRAEGVQVSVLHRDLGRE
ncbi:RNase adapter RapZ [Propionimicrobium sp. PCR01-08-3]|uniref:RNase adapter RapZ n=1 Tax=Propionimicrobium sp. PCR01-08-3 TaxID=3052086 RepID=UPI00255CF6FA|nr:RNase adapter RapZ [Propionimicrobium sp. PCR01-08-3]WIY81623.1 RNase adapter RapZ [Propionimicrobium sp. PCR01-08-3]